MTRIESLTRRSAIRLGGVAVGAVLLAGCGGPADDDPEDSEAEGGGEAHENDTGDPRAPGDDADEEVGENGDPDGPENEDDEDNDDDDTDDGNDDD